MLQACQLCPGPELSHERAVAWVVERGQRRAAGSQTNRLFVWCLRDRTARGTPWHADPAGTPGSDAWMSGPCAVCLPGQAAPADRVALCSTWQTPSGERLRVREVWQENLNEEVCMR